MDKRSIILFCDLIAFVLALFDCTVDISLYGAWALCSEVLYGAGICDFHGDLTLCLDK
jgi:hypothetical protein